MNLLHVKQALEVAKAGSLNKASETLLIAAPNISRSIKELESELGIIIFNRTQNGMELTPDGIEFVNFAKDILNQIDELEKFYKNGSSKKQKFSICVPRACYISDAFARFSNLISKDAAEIFYKETNTQNTIRNVLNEDYKLGIVRYPENYDKYYKALFDEKDLQCELVSEFTYSLIMSADCKLAQIDNITFDDLIDFIEISHADPRVPSTSLAKVIKEERPDNINRKIYIFERASQFDLLSTNHETFMWVSPPPNEVLERYNLVIKKCIENKKVYKDMLIYKAGYKLSKLDRQFITSLCESKRKYL